MKHAWVALMLACGGGPRAAVDDAVAAKDVPRALSAYDGFREADGSDIALLAEIASLVLELEALSDDPERVRAAITQLRLAGNAGLPALHRLADAEGITLVRALALEALAKRGDGSARAFLFAMIEEDDPELVALAISAADPEEDSERLIALLDDTHPPVRAAAALALGGLTESIDSLHGLAQLSRVDPEATVRNAAVRALGGFGASAVPFLRERMGDADSSVRLAVVRSLVRADRDASLEIIASLLATPPSQAGIEAARVIALTGEPRDDDEPSAEGVGDARAYLLASLGDENPNLRSQAAVALVSLRAHAPTDAALVRALGTETEPGVRLGLARALRGREVGDAEAEAALGALLEGDGMPAVQAALLLSAEGREDALTRLEAALEDEDSLIRRVAARGLAKDAGRPDQVRALMRDEDVLVRIHAAGGILAAAN